jgi:molybdopterin/thiamine biosynthesis adenylyltransferase
MTMSKRGAIPAWGTLPVPATAEIFQRSLTAHLPLRDFARLSSTSVLVGGLGGGSNIAELLVRKGVGHLLLADPDVYEFHNVRQRGSLVSTWGRPKAEVVAERLRDIHPHIKVVSVPEGVTSDNAASLVDRSDYVVDMLDFHALPEKVALYREARRQRRTVVTAPSVVNGAVLYVFTPEGPAFEEFFGIDLKQPLETLALRFLKRLIPHFPPEAPEALYRAAARGERTIPLDAVGVDQAAVLAVAALENLILGRPERVVTAPRGLQVDVSDPGFLVRILE